MLNTRFCSPHLRLALEAHDIIEGALLVLGTELDIGPGAVAGVGVPTRPTGRRGPKRMGISTPGGHDLNGHTALVDRD